MFYVFRIPLIIVYFLAVALAGLIISLFRPFNPDNTTLIGRIYGWGGTRILGMKVNVRGKEHLQGLGACVITANHQDNLDLFVYGGMLPRRTVSLGKKSLRYIPFFGQMYWLAGNVLINRSSKTQSLATMNEATVALRDNNTSIWIFPEGTRNRGKNMLRFKKGAFKTAQEAGVPVLPVCASSYVKHMNLGKWHSGTVEIQILPPIMPERLATDNLDGVIDECWNNMMETIEQLDSTLEQAEQKPATANSYS